MGNAWEMTLNGHDELLRKMERYADKSEETINDVLKESGSPLAMKNIEKLIPVSDGELQRGYKHAKYSKALQVELINLGFIIRPKKGKRGFEYIKYPDLGIGTSQFNQPQEFMKRGLEMSIDSIVEDLLTGFDKLNT